MQKYNNFLYYQNIFALFPSDVPLALFRSVIYTHIFFSHQLPPLPPKTSIPLPISGNFTPFLA